MPQMAYSGPVPEWFNSGVAHLSKTQAAELEKRLADNPNDTCARGYLIAHGGSAVPDPGGHVLWMTRNNPQWPGFLIARGSITREQHEHIEAAWLAHCTLQQKDGATLHHAAVFFTRSDPAFAAMLLSRAIELEPHEPYHREGLGMLYGRALIPSHRDNSFAAEAEEQLLDAKDWLIMAGALRATAPYSRVLSRGQEPWITLTNRLRDRRIGSPVHDRSYPYACPVIPLEDRCEDHLR